MARLPRERLLKSVSAHRESHRVAHEALAHLGEILDELAAVNLTQVLGASQRVRTTLGREDEEIGAKGVGEGEGEGQSKSAAAAEAEGAEDSTWRVQDGTDEEATSAAAEASKAAAKTAEPESELTLESRLMIGLNETLSAFAIPLEMLDEEVRISLF